MRFLVSEFSGVGPTDPVLMTLTFSQQGQSHGHKDHFESHVEKFWKVCRFSSYINNFGPSSVIRTHPFRSKPPNQPEVTTPSRAPLWTLLENRPRASVFFQLFGTNTRVFFRHKYFKFCGDKNNCDSEAAMDTKRQPLTWQLVFGWSDSEVRGQKPPTLKESFGPVSHRTKPQQSPTLPFTKRMLLLIKNKKVVLNISNN